MERANLCARCVQVAIVVYDVVGDGKPLLAGRLGGQDAPCLGLGLRIAGQKAPNLGLLVTVDDQNPVHERL